MGYKLIALDIDGTIRSPDYPVSDRTREVTARVRDAGAVVTLATGRMYHSALRSSADLNIKSPIASFQGAQIRDPASGEVLWHKPFVAGDGQKRVGCPGAVGTRGNGLL